MISVIIKKEMKIFFRAPLTYLIAGMFTLIVGWIFFNQLTYFIENVQKLPVHMRNHYDFANEVVIKMFGNINFLMVFFIPILTMRSFAQEYRDETINFYFTSATVSDYELILGKYISYFLMGSFVIGTTFIFPLFLSNIEIADSSFLYTGSLGVFLNLACYCGLGCLASSISKNQIVAALVGFVFVFSTWLMAMFAQSADQYLVGEILRFLSINHHFQNFAKGKISLSNLSFYISFMVLTFFLIHKRLGMRYWK